MQNSGVLVADNGLTISADTIFNSRGAMSGQDVKLAATDSVLNAGGSVQGGTVSVTAVNDVISASDTVTFTSPTVTATHIGKQGSITADGDLTVVAGKNIGVFGSDVAAEEDLRLAVIVSTQALGTHAATSGKGFNTRTDETVNHAASVTAGGALNIDAGGSVTVHGSQMASGDAMTVKAGGDVAVTAASDTVDYHGHSSSKGGGFFGGKKSSTSVRQDSISVASQLESGGDMTIEAGTSGDGAATIAGSQLTSGGDMSVTAADDVLVTSVTDQRYAQDEEQKKGTFTSKMALDETRKIDVVRSELDAKGDVVVASRTGDVTVKASQLRADGAVALKAEQGGVALLTDKELAYERHVSSDTGWLTWSSRDKGTSAETVLHTLIESGENIFITAKDGVVVEFHHTGDARTDVQQLAKTPGLEWMAGLLERDDVDWRAAGHCHCSIGRDVWCGFATECRDNGAEFDIGAYRRDSGHAHGPYGRVCVVELPGGYRARQCCRGWRFQGDPELHRVGGWCAVAAGKHGAGRDVGHHDFNDQGLRHGWADTDRGSR